MYKTLSKDVINFLFKIIESVENKKSVKSLTSNIIHDLDSILADTYSDCVNRNFYEPVYNKPDPNLNKRYSDRQYFAEWCELLIKYPSLREVFKRTFFAYDDKKQEYVDLRNKVEDIISRVAQKEKHSKAYLRQCFLEEIEPYVFNREEMTSGCSSTVF